VRSKEARHSDTLLTPVIGHAKTERKEGVTQLVPTAAASKTATPTQATASKASNQDARNKEAEARWRSMMMKNAMKKSAVAGPPVHRLPSHTDKVGTAALLRDISTVARGAEQFAAHLKERRVALGLAWERVRAAQSRIGLGEGESALAHAKGMVRTAAQKLMKRDVEHLGRAYKLARELLSDGCFEKSAPSQVSVHPSEEQFGMNPKVPFAKGVSLLVKSVGVAYSAGYAASWG